MNSAATTQRGDPATTRGFYDVCRAFCVQMVTGQAPPLAPRVADVPVYSQVAVGPLAKVKAYLGVPLLLDDGELFGTVCAYAGAAQPDSLAESMPTVTLLARMRTRRIPWSSAGNSTDR